MDAMIVAYGAILALCVLTLAIGGVVLALIYRVEALRHNHNALRGEIQRLLEGKPEGVSRTQIVQHLSKQRGGKKP
jgi:hypothetical protein